MQNLLFRRIEVWLVLLLALLSVVGTLAFGALVLDAERGKDRFGVASAAALSLADIPEVVHTMLQRGRAMAATKWNRFADEPGGWTFGGAARPPGYLLLSRYDGAASRHVVELVSLADGEVLHAWRPVPEDLLDGAPRTSKVADFTGWDNVHYRMIHPLPLADGSLIIKDHQSFPMRIDACGKLMWRQDAYLAHHSTELDDEGHVWLPALLEPSTIDNVQEGFYEDGLMELDIDGNVLSVVSVPEILIENGMEWAVFNASNRNHDPVHLNDLQPILTDGPFWKKGDLLLSMRHISMLMIYRPSTREIVWMKNGPWLAQHDADILDDHRIAVFDNHAYDKGLGARVDGANRVVVYDFANGLVSAPWNAALSALGVMTLSEGLQEVLPDGSVMIEEENSGRLLFLDASGETVAQYLNKTDDGTSWRLGWSRWLPAAEAEALLAAASGAACDPAP